MPFGNSVLICFGHSGGRTEIMRFMNNLADRLTEFIDYEAKSCSMDFGCVTPLYIIRRGGM